MGDTTTRGDLRRSTVPFADAVDCAHDLSWTRDPFDRLVVADALAANDQLITSDRTIRANFPTAIWS